MANDETTAGATRRQMLQRVAIGGATVWAAPSMLTTVSAHAQAISDDGTTIPPTTSAGPTSTFETLDITVPGTFDYDVPAGVVSMIVTLIGPGGAGGSTTGGGGGAFARGTWDTTSQTQFTYIVFDYGVFPNSIDFGSGQGGAFTGANLLADGGSSGDLGGFGGIAFVNVGPGFSDGSTADGGDADGASPGGAGGPSGAGVAGGGGTGIGDGGPLDAPGQFGVLRLELFTS